MTQLARTTQYFESSNSQWIFPSQENLEYEYKYEYLKHLRPRVGNIFPTLEGFIQACQAGSQVEVNEKMDMRISGRSHTSNQRDLLSLISTYSSFGTRRSAQTLQNLYNRIQNGESLFMPLVLVQPNGRQIIMGGNTRMDVAFQLGINPTVVMVGYE